MRRLVVTALIMLIGAISLFGCSSSPLADTGFTKISDGVYTYIDTKTSPLPQGGIKIDLIQGSQGYVKFTVTDNAGKETVDFYKFTPSNTTMHRYRYVAAMGIKYNYYFDYAAMNLVKVTDANDAEVTDSMKKAGRWDSAATETKEHATSLVSYFKTKFGTTMEQAVAK